MKLLTSTLSDRLKRIAARGTLALVLALVALGWWAFANPPQFTPPGSESWSKGIYSGTASLNQTVALQVDRDGAYLVWVDQAKRLHFTTIDEQGLIKSDEFLAIATLSPRSPQLVLGPDKMLHLAWLDGRGTQGLYYAQIDRSGGDPGEPLVISGEGETVSAFDMAFNDRAELEMFWSNAEGLFHATLTGQDQAPGPPTLLWLAGDRPALQVDKTGLFHLVFVEPFGSLNHHVFYTTFDPATKTFHEPLEIAATFRRGGQILEGPALGLDNENVYLFWSKIDSRDVTSTGFYTSFPIDNPQPTSPSTLSITGGDYPSGIWPLDGQRSQMIAALSGQVFARGEREFQVLTGVFTDGRFEGHQLVSAGRRPSLKPALAADKDGNLHGAWLDAGRLQAYRVVYASTQPTMKETLSSLTLHDIIDSLFGAILSLVFIAGVLPFLIVWGIVPLIIVLVYFFATGQDMLTQRQTWWVLGLAGLAQVLIMIFVSPDNNYLSAFWRVSLPILLAAPAALALYLFAVRRKMSSLFGAFFLFIFTHGVLRLIITTLILSGPR